MDGDRRRFFPASRAGRAGASSRFRFVPDCRFVGSSVPAGAVAAGAPDDYERPVRRKPHAASARQRTANAARNSGSTGRVPGMDGDRRRFFPASRARRATVLPVFFSAVALFPLGGVLVAPAPLEAAGVPADEPAAMRMTVRMDDPARITATTRVRPSVSGPRPAFRRLALGADGFRAEPLLPAGETGGELRFETAPFPADDDWVRLPVPLPDSGAALSFAAELTPPPGYRIVDLFPRARETLGGVARVRTPAPPSLLRFRLVPADASGFGLAALVDGVALSILLGLAGLGAFRLFRSGPPDAGRTNGDAE